jgi:hypothetical protein
VARVSLDDFGALQQAKSDPASLWIDADHIIIDEAQKTPEIFPAIKLTAQGYVWDTQSDMFQALKGLFL